VPIFVIKGIIKILTDLLFCPLKEQLRQVQNGKDEQLFSTKDCSNFSRKLNKKLKTKK